jgi:hypothetical protein
VLGTFAYRFNSSPIAIGSVSSTVVDALPVPRSGNYMVNATATTIQGGSSSHVGCRLVDVSRNGAVVSETPWMYNVAKPQAYGTIAVDGAMPSVGVTSTIEERCLWFSPKWFAEAEGATMGDVLVTEVSAPPQAPTRKTPTNTFRAPTSTESGGKSNRVGG